MDSCFVNTWLLSSSPEMSLIVCNGVGKQLSQPQQATTQQLYNYFVSYITSPEVLKVSAVPSMHSLHRTYLSHSQYCSAGYGEAYI